MMIRIDIPDKKPADAAASTVITVLKQEGIDPRRALDQPMMRQLCMAWSRGELDEAGFRRACRNMLILNPGLASS